jgi:hypothetical protein
LIFQKPKQMKTTTILSLLVLCFTLLVTTTTLAQECGFTITNGAINEVLEQESLGLIRVTHETQKYLKICNTDFPGNSVQTFLTNKYEDCLYNCFKAYNRNQCYGVSYDTVNKVCELKGGMGTPVTNPNFISGRIPGPRCVDGVTQYGDIIHRYPIPFSNIGLMYVALCGYNIQRSDIQRCGPAATLIECARICADNSNECFSITFAAERVRFGTSCCQKRGRGPIDLQLRGNHDSATSQRYLTK